MKSPELVSGLDGELLQFTTAELKDRHSGCLVCEVALCRSRRRKIWVVASAVVCMLVLDWILTHFFLGTSLIVHFTLLLLVVAYLVFTFVCTIYKESLLVVSSLGVQVTTTYWSGYCSSSFIALPALADVIINEAVSMHRVIFYLAVLVGEGKGAESKVHKVIPIFSDFSPRLETIETAYHTIRRTLYSVDDI